MFFNKSGVVKKVCGVILMLSHAPFFFTKVYKITSETLKFLSQVFYYDDNCAIMRKNFTY